MYVYEEMNKIMTNISINAIYNKLKKVLPSKWKRVAFFAGYTQGSYTMKYYVDDGKSGYVDCFKLNNVSKSTIIHTFTLIDKIIQSERDKLIQPQKWNVLSLFIDSDGHVTAKFAYDDISEDAISYEQEWKKKYLK